MVLVDVEILLVSSVVHLGEGSGRDLRRHDCGDEVVDEEVLVWLRNVMVLRHCLELLNL